MRHTQATGVLTSGDISDVDRFTSGCWRLHNERRKPTFYKAVRSYLANNDVCQLGKFHRLACIGCSWRVWPSQRCPELRRTSVILRMCGSYEKKDLVCRVGKAKKLVRRGRRLRFVQPFRADSGTLDGFRTGRYKLIPPAFYLQILHCFRCDYRKWRLYQMALLFMLRSNQAVRPSGESYPGSQYL